MPIRADKIPGFLVNKENCADKMLSTSQPQEWNKIIKSRGFNEAIDAMSPRELTLNREKLLSILIEWDMYCPEDIADAIIENESTLIECKGKE